MREEIKRRKAAFDFLRDTSPTSQQVNAYEKRHASNQHLFKNS